MAARFSGPGKPLEGIATMTPTGPRWTGDIVCLEDALFAPLRWKRPHMIFVNSMSDLFHEQVPFDFILHVFEVMAGAHWHTFQVLTKRSRRCADLSPHLPWPKNVWMGVSVENADYLPRLDDLRKTKASVKFVSIEPLLGALPSLDLKGIDWVIVGGESGPGARPMDATWVLEIRDQCQHADVRFFFRQWGHIRNNPDPADPTAKKNGGKAKGGRLLEDRT
jgi:protein gp37